MATTTPEPMESLEPTQTMSEQEKFYHDRTYLASIFILVMLALGVVTLGTLLLLRGVTSPSPVFFALTDQGQLVQEVPLDQPNMEDNILLDWVAEAVMSINTFNFINYTTVMNESKEYFTSEGYASYQTAMATNKIPDQVVAQKLVMKAAPTDAPQITKAGPFGGRYLWKVKIPMVFRFQNMTLDTFTAIDITLLVLRVPTIQAANGILILKYDLDVKGRRT